MSKESFSPFFLNMDTISGKWALVAANGAGMNFDTPQDS
jgi:hypothetical protein